MCVKRGSAVCDGEIARWICVLLDVNVNELTPTLTFLRIIGKSAGDTVWTSETQNPLQENADNTTLLSVAISFVI